MISEPRLPRGSLVEPMSLAQSATAAPSAPVVAAICAAEILGLAGFSIVPALLPQFIEAWSLTNTQRGWLAGIVSAAGGGPGCREARGRGGRSTGRIP